MAIPEDELTRNREFLRDSMPADTEEVEVDGTTGYVFQFKCREGDPYEVLLKYEASLYYAYLFHPELPEDINRFKTHVRSDGAICLDRWTVGARTLAQGYVMSVLWCNAYSIYLRTGTFPFTLTNA
jgi:hypothetical protein